MPNRQFVLGRYHALCDVCGFSFHDNELQKRWDGMMVCHKDFETRHPQDFAKVPRTEKSPEWTRPGIQSQATTSVYDPDTKTSTDTTTTIEGGTERVVTWVASSVGIQS